MCFGFCIHERKIWLQIFFLKETWLFYSKLHNKKTFFNQTLIQPTFLKIQTFNRAILSQRGRNIFMLPFCLMKNVKREFPQNKSSWNSWAWLAVSQEFVWKKPSSKLICPKFCGVVQWSSVPLSAFSTLLSNTKRQSQTKRYQTKFMNF